MKRQPPIQRWDQETTLVIQIASFVSLFSFLFYFRRGDLLLYGDAVAHINIARRVIDSLTPGPLQLGTVWLPLPHLLMVPFLFSDSAWRTGIAGSIPSLLAYVLGTVGIFRLVRSVLSGNEKPDAAARVAAWIAMLIYAANPNLIYLQSTAMTEALYLALFIWAIVHFAEFVIAVRANPKVSSSLLKCGWSVLGACLTRYDGWFLAVVLVSAAVLVTIQFLKANPILKIALVKFVLLCAAGPLLWVAYNAAVYRNPLEFANGPYSARAIEQRSATVTMPSHPGAHDLPVAFSYFFKSAQINMVEGAWQRVWVLVLLAGTLIVLLLQRSYWPLLLLWLPIPFYMLSIAYSGVPIFLPTWWPFSLYNVRYGLEMLPAFAALVAVLVYSGLKMRKDRWTQATVVVAAAAVISISYISAWRVQPVCYREAWTNSRTRLSLETALATNLQMLPHDSTFLMYLGDHVGALQQAGIPLHQVINEGNHRPWKAPADPQGLWERALAEPQQYADYVIAFDGDPVAAKVDRNHLQSVVVLHTPGQPLCTVYWTRRPPGNHSG